MDREAAAVLALLRDFGPGTTVDWMARDLFEALIRRLPHAQAESLARQYPRP